MKKKITLKKHINPSIKVGDKVRMVDGSAFSYSGKQTESLFIVQSYPELTGLNAIIKDIDATVLAVNIDNVATLWRDSSAYITDIKLSIGNGEFFTCSKFVEKVEDEQLLNEPFTLPKNWHVVVTEENQKEVSEWRFKTPEKICLGFIAGVVYKVPQDRYEKGHNPGDLIKKPDYDFGTEITTEQFRKYVLKKEVEQKFEVGDWVYHIKNEFTGISPRCTFIARVDSDKIWCKDYKDESHLGIKEFSEYYRLATPDEIPEAEISKTKEKTFPRMMLVWDGDNEKNAVRREVHAYVPTTPNPWITSRTRYGHAKEIPVSQPIYLTAQDVSEGKGVGVDPKLIKFKE